MYKVGDRVKIIKKFQRIVGIITWNGYMDVTIGMYGTIIGIRKRNGMKVYDVEFENFHQWTYLEESFGNYREEKLRRILNV